MRLSNLERTHYSFIPLIVPLHSKRFGTADPVSVAVCFSQSLRSRFSAAFSPRRQRGEEKSRIKNKNCGIMSVPKPKKKRKSLERMDVVFRVNGRTHVAVASDCCATFGAHAKRQVQGDGRESAAHWLQKCSLLLRR